METTTPSASALNPTPTLSGEFFAQPAKFLEAIADATRWSILQLLAAGAARTVSELASALKRDPDVISRHLHVLREVGAVTLAHQADADHRKQFYVVPERFRRVGASGKAELDFGLCVLRFP